MALKPHSYELLREPNTILLEEDYQPLELLIYLLTWAVEIALAFTLAIVYFRG